MIYYAVVGRVPDGENEVHFFESPEALGAEIYQMFSDALWEGYPETERKEIQEGYGADWIIDAILVSESKIKEKGEA